MKRRCAILTVMCILATTIGTAAARSIEERCPSIKDAGNPSKTIYKQSAPLRSGGLDSPIVGFRKEPTLIFNRRNFRGGAHRIYDSTGVALARCPVVSAHGHAGRARCTIQTSSLRSRARRNSKRETGTASPTIYFKIQRNLCVRVPDAGRCVGSVKGLCDRLIK
jgi:hypothetical protein